MDEDDTECEGGTSCLAWNDWEQSLWECQLEQHRREIHFVKK